MGSDPARDGFRKRAVPRNNSILRDDTVRVITWRDEIRGDDDPRERTKCIGALCGVETLTLKNTIRPRPDTSSSRGVSFLPIHIAHEVNKSFYSFLHFFPCYFH